MRNAVRDCRARYDQAAIADAQRAAILTVVGQRITLDFEPDLMKPPRYFGRRGGEIRGRIDSDGDHIAFYLSVTNPEALALADHISQRLRSIGDAPAPEDYPPF
ncbi:hypothetical protein [Nocardia sp. CNY236]|uniref:hypothetical protein n=1 Tax=Nocardia sp. CNY236 TaxID=1169152 RepID=UPI0012DFA46D|nr:hypothetical protein [Nocardia sp. CNY236]